MSPAPAIRPAGSGFVSAGGPSRDTARASTSTVAAAGAEPGAVAELPKAAIRPRERFLGDVLGVLALAENAVGHPEREGRGLDEAGLELARQLVSFHLGAAREGCRCLHPRLTKPDAADPHSVHVAVERRACGSHPNQTPPLRMRVHWPAVRRDVRPVDLIGAMMRGVVSTIIRPWEGRVRSCGCGQPFWRSPV